jgi:flagellar motor component MotA
LAALVGATLMATKRRNAALVLAISMAVVGTAIGVAKAFGVAKPHQT